MSADKRFSFRGAGKWDLPVRNPGTTFAPMSVSQIIDELPSLTPADLRAVRRKLVELSEENEDIALCDAAALEAAQELDRLEQEGHEG